MKYRIYRTKGVGELFYTFNRPCCPFEFVEFSIPDHWEVGTVYNVCPPTLGPFGHKNLFVTAAYIVARLSEAEEFSGVRILNWKPDSEAHDTPAGLGRNVDMEA